VRGILPAKDGSLTAHTAQGHSHGMRPLKPALQFLVDSREQRRFVFSAPVKKEFRDGGTLVRGLSEGDYSVCIDSGAPLSIRIERKSLGDLYGVVGHGRERFERELDRLRAHEYRAIVVEATADDILKGYERSQISGRAALKSLGAWAMDYGVHAWLMESHRRAGGWCQYLLERFAAQHLKARESDGQLSTRIS